MSKDIHECSLYFCWKWVGCYRRTVRCSEFFGECCETTARYP